MQSRSLTFLFIIVSLMFSGTMSVYATPQTYEAYQRESTNYCDGAERTWAQDKSLVPKIDYSEFATGAINATLAKSRNNTQTSNDEKLRIKSDLDPIRIGEYSGFKALEIARVNYRTQMNSLFACGIISSRIDTLDELTKLINQKIKPKKSNIQEALERESDKLK